MPCVGAVCAVVWCRGLLCVRDVLCACWCVWVFVCVVVCVVVCGLVFVVVWHAENPRVCVQNVPVCTSTTHTCVSKCARGAGIHGRVRREEEGRGGSSPVLLTKTAHVEVSLFPQKSSPKETF